MNKKLLFTTLLITQQLFGASSLSFLFAQHKTTQSTFTTGGCCPESIKKKNNYLEKKWENFVKNIYKVLQKKLNKKETKTEDKD